MRLSNSLRSGHCYGPPLYTVAVRNFLQAGLFSPTVPMKQLRERHDFQNLEYLNSV